MQSVKLAAELQVKRADVAERRAGDPPSGHSTAWETHRCLTGSLLPSI
jgi:hypothetical protein